MTEKQFPVLLTHLPNERRAWLEEGCPTEVLYAIVERHEEQALINHKQSVLRLSEHGGLSPQELLAVLSDCALGYMLGMNIQTVVALLRFALKEEEEYTLRNRGYSTHRFKDNPEEQRFAEAWDAHNRSLSLPGYLAYLLTLGDQRFPVEPSERDRRVAATVIQWLGSPVGRGFLEDLGYTKKE